MRQITFGCGVARIHIIWIILSVIIKTVYKARLMYRQWGGLGKPCITYTSLTIIHNYIHIIILINIIHASVTVPTHCCPSPPDAIVSQKQEEKLIISSTEGQNICQVIADINYLQPLKYIGETNLVDYGQI